MKKFSVQKFGQIFGETSDFEEAKHYAINLGPHAIVFYGSIVVYPI